MNKPFFSIIIPVYNREMLVSETINSVLNQNVKDYEIIVINDGSTDNTLQVLDQYRNSIIIINQENQGAEIARNIGGEHANGDYLVFLDSDDILLPNALSIYAQVIKTENNPALVFAKATAFTNGSNMPVSKPVSSRSKILYTRNKSYFAKREPVWLGTSMLVLKRELWNSNCYFKRGTFPVDDLDFMLRIGCFKNCIIIKSPATVGYRCHGSNSINDIPLNLNKLLYILQLERCGEYAGGPQKKIDHLALIGGHLVCWCKKGIKKRYYRNTFLLLTKGVPAILAGFYKKCKSLMAAQEDAYTGFTDAFIIDEKLEDVIGKSSKELKTRN